MYFFILFHWALFDQFFTLWMWTRGIMGEKVDYLHMVQKFKESYYKHVCKSLDISSFSNLCATNWAFLIEQNKRRKSNVVFKGKTRDDQIWIMNLKNIVNCLWGKAVIQYLFSDIRRGQVDRSVNPKTRQIPNTSEKRNAEIEKKYLDWIRDELWWLERVYSNYISVYGFPDCCTQNTLLISVRF